MKSIFVSSILVFFLSLNAIAQLEISNNYIFLGDIATKTIKKQDLSVVVRNTTGSDIKITSITPLTIHPAIGLNFDERYTARKKRKTLLSFRINASKATKKMEAAYLIKFQNGQSTNIYLEASLKPTFKVKKADLKLGTVKANDTIIKSFTIKNTSDHTLQFYVQHNHDHSHHGHNHSHSHNHKYTHNTPNPIKPGEKGKFTVTIPTSAYCKTIEETIILKTQYKYDKPATINISGKNSSDVGFGTLTLLKEKHKVDTIKAGDVIEAEFPIKNTGDGPLYITGVKTTCGCTVADYKKEAIMPGETVNINAKFNSKGKRNKQRKSIRITTNDCDNPTKSVLIETFVK